MHRTVKSKSAPMPLREMQGTINRPSRTRNLKKGFPLFKKKGTSRLPRSHPRVTREIIKAMLAIKEVVHSRIPLIRDAGKSPPQGVITTAHTKASYLFNLNQFIVRTDIQGERYGARGEGHH